MNPPQEFDGRSEPPLPLPPVPRRVLRHLIVGHGLGVGSRVLDTGRDQGQLVQFLRALRLEADALTERESDGPLPDHHYDLVIARDLPEYGRSLRAIEARRTTARLLAAVRPGGSFVVLIGQDGDGLDPCAVEQHLNGLPGACTVATFTESALPPVAPWRWLARPAATRSFQAITLSLPPTPLTRDQWRQWADAHDPATCRAEDAQPRRVA